MMDEKVVLHKFNSTIHLVGYVFVTLALIFNFLPAVYASIASGIFPEIGDLVGLWIAAASAFGVGWFVQPVSFFPMTNMAGTMMGWISGNVGEIRVPAAAMAQKVANTEDGSPKAQFISALGMGGSVWVSTLLVTVFTLIGATILPLMPAVVMKAFGYVLPAVLGAVYASLAIKNLAIGAVVIVASFAGKMLFPLFGIPSGLVMLLNIFIAVLIARVFFELTKKNA